MLRPQVENARLLLALAAERSLCAQAERGQALAQFLVFGVDFMAFCLLVLFVVDQPARPQACKL